MCHVLIIEDEPLLAMDLEALLEREGATSFAFAASEREAVSEAIARKPDLITSDISLREGSGPSAVEVIHETLGPVPVIFITATPNACKIMNTDAPIMGKPFDRVALARTFRALIPRA